MKKVILFSVLATSMQLSHAASGRDTISIVGSSTVFPFSTTVAEQFGKAGQFNTPKIESTGSGGGFKLFCTGNGIDTPDITNASRAIKQSEIDICKSNGVTGITEFIIGYDGIAIANKVDAPKFDFTRKNLFLALAKNVPDPKNPSKLIENPYQKWSDIDSSLPNIEIEVLGPPPTSGTRDAFSELVLEKGCEEYSWIKALAKTDKKQYKAICHGVREDGKYIEAGENDNLIVQKLEQNPKALGIFGYSFLEQNSDKVKGNPVDGIAPDFDAISSGKYEVSRPLFFYVKNSHVGKIPGIQEYVDLFTTEDVFGPDGYLVDKGLIPLPEEKRNEMHKRAEQLK